MDWVIGLDLQIRTKSKLNRSKPIKLFDLTANSVNIGTVNIETPSVGTTSTWTTSVVYMYFVLLNQIILKVSSTVKHE